MQRRRFTKAPFASEEMTAPDVMFMKTIESKLIESYNAKLKFLGDSWDELLKHNEAYMTGLFEIELPPKIREEIMKYPLTNAELYSLR